MTLPQTLSIRSIRAVAVLVLLCWGAPVSASLVLFDDFDSYTVGNGSGGQQLVDATGGLWQQTPSFTSNADIADDGGGDLYFAYGTSGTFRGGYRNDGFSIPDGAAGNLVYWQMRIAPGQAADSSFGITRSATPGAFGDYAVQVVLNGDSTSGYELRARDNTSFATLQTGLVSDTWYDITVDVNTATDTFDLYIDSDQNPATLGTLVGDDLQFRNPTTANSTSSLEALFGFGGGPPEAVHIDDIYLSVIPEPTSALSAILVTAACTATRLRRRR